MRAARRARWSGRWFPLLLAFVFSFSVVCPSSWSSVDPEPPPEPWQIIDRNLFGGDPVFERWFGPGGRFPRERVQAAMREQVRRFLDKYANPNTPVPDPVEVAPYKYQRQTYGRPENFGCSRNRRNNNFGGHTLVSSMLYIAYTMMKKHYPEDPLTIRLRDFLGVMAEHIVKHCLTYDPATGLVGVPGEGMPTYHQSSFRPFPDLEFNPAGCLMSHRPCVTYDTDGIRHNTSTERFLSFVILDKSIPCDRRLVKAVLKLLVRSSLSRSVGGPSDVRRLGIADSIGGKLRSLQILHNLMGSYEVFRNDPAEQELAGKIGVTILELFDVMMVEYGKPIRYRSEDPNDYEFEGFLTGKNCASLAILYPETTQGYPYHEARCVPYGRDGAFVDHVWSWGTSLWPNVGARMWVDLPEVDTVRRSVIAHVTVKEAEHIKQRKKMPRLRDHSGRLILDGTCSPRRFERVLGGAYADGRPDFPDPDAEIARSFGARKQPPPECWAGQPEYNLWDWTTYPRWGGPTSAFIGGGGLAPWEFKNKQEWDEEDPGGKFLRYAEDPNTWSMPMIPMNFLESTDAPVEFNRANGLHNLRNVPPSEQRNIMRWPAFFRHPSTGQVFQPGDPFLGSNGYPIERASGFSMSMVYDLNRTPPVWRSTYQGVWNEPNRNNGFNLTGLLVYAGLLTHDRWYIDTAMYYTLGWLVYGRTGAVRVGRVGDLVNPPQLIVGDWTNDPFGAREFHTWWVFALLWGWPGAWPEIGGLGQLIGLQPQAPAISDPAVQGVPESPTPAPDPLATLTTDSLTTD